MEQDDYEEGEILDSEDDTKHSEEVNSFNFIVHFIFHCKPKLVGKYRFEYWFFSVLIAMSMLNKSFS